VAKSGGAQNLKALESEKWGGSSLAALQKFMPMYISPQPSPRSWTWLYHQKANET